MEAFSQIERNMDGLAARVEAESFRRPAPAWSGKDSADSARLARVVRAESDFWYFDRTYFPAEMHSDYAKPGKAHKDMLKYFLSKGELHVIAGFRKLAKTAYGKKIIVWMLLTGRVHFIGTLAETLIPTSRNILSDIITIVRMNPRISSDFKVVIIEDNADQFAFQVGSTKEQMKKMRYGQAFAEGRSVRGSTREFGRPELLFVDDLETLASPMGSEQVQKRIRVLVEAHQSLDDKGTTIACCNLFDERCAMNQIRLHAANNLLPPGYHVHIYPAWNGASGWKERYPAQTESEMRAFMNPLDESDWQGNYQQNPTPPEGITFLRQYYREAEIPDDAKGVLYVDPNLSKKGKGDTTAIVELLYSARTDMYYVARGRCKSYSDSNELLADLLAMKTTRARRIGFDGHVSQESTWTNNVRNYCLINQMPYPQVYYCRYHTDDCAKNLQVAYNSGRLMFAPGFSTSEEGQRFLAQFFAFQGKKARGKDDAPDALICSYEFIHEQHLVKRKSRTSTTSVPDVYDSYTF